LLPHRRADRDPIAATPSAAHTPRRAASSIARLADVAATPSAGNVTSTIRAFMDRIDRVARIAGDHEHADCFAWSRLIAGERTPPIGVVKPVTRDLPLAACTLTVCD
jgi:hypothetical protein